MIKVNNAVILAAGMSTRLAPLSFEKPKALLKVRGEVIIERQICQLIEAGITDITIVVGYLKEQFEYLCEKYGVVLVENPYYEVRNNHSSLYVVKEKLGNTYISCGDLYFLENPFEKEVEHPYYATQYKSGETDEWCVYSDETGKITNVVIGGEDAWVMQGEALFDETFSEQLVPLIEKAFQNPEETNAYWESLYIENIEEMHLYEKKNEGETTLEFDDLEELRRQEPEYRNHTQCKIMEFLAEKLQCEEKELENFEPVKKEGIVTGVIFSCFGKRYRYDYYKKENLYSLEEGV